MLLLTKNTLAIRYTLLAIMIIIHHTTPRILKPHALSLIPPQIAGFLLM